jgi:uncharacterized protein YqeY
MLRKRLSEALTNAMKAKDTRRVSTVRLINAAIKDRDIATRGEGDGAAVSDEEILNILQKMIKQRHDSIAHYEVGGRLALVEQEQEEIEIIREFLPTQISDEEMEQAINEVIAEVGATGIKDMGRTMGTLKERYAGRMDFAQAAGLVKSLLAG